MPNEITNNIETYRKVLGERIVKEGVELWKRQQEHERLKKLREQREAKRFAGTFDLGRSGGGGAPLVTSTGKKWTRTREDPSLRFQFGSHDLRKCVDNTLRYKTDKNEQEAYRKELGQFEKKAKFARCTNITQ